MTYNFFIRFKLNDLRKYYIDDPCNHNCCQKKFKDCF